jgi:hypothetical protein
MARMKTVAPAPAMVTMKRRFLLVPDGAAGAGPALAGTLGLGRTPDTSPVSAGVSSRAE